MNINAYVIQLEAFRVNGLCDGLGAPAEGKILFGQIKCEPGSCLRLKDEEVRKTPNFVAPKRGYGDPKIQKLQVVR